MSGSRNPNVGVIAAPMQELTSAPDDWRNNLGRSSLPLDTPRSADWWTGLAPALCPGFDRGRLHSLPLPSLASCSRQAVLDYFNNTWTINELLFSSLNGDEAFYRPPYHGLRHPLIFYYVHPSVLYVNKLRLAGLLPGAVNAYFEHLFDIGVDEMSWDDMSKNGIQWPTIDEARQYRRQIYAIVKSLIESHPDFAEGHPPILQEHPLWALFMGFEHERIHIETSSVLIRELPEHLVSPPPEWPDLAPVAGLDYRNAPVVGLGYQNAPVAGLDYPDNSFVSVAAAEVHIGKPADWPTYGWDNEYGQRSVSLSAFSAGRFLVSNGEYWQFVVDGGYRQRANWTETGWQWRSFRDVKCPTFWVPDDSVGPCPYRLRTCFEIIEMQWSWPVIVNYHEARAFAQWKSDKDGQDYRLLTEAEHQALRKVSNFCNADQQQFLPPQPYNTNLRHGSESAVDGASNGTIGDLFGNVWQWLEDHFNPLDGFGTHPYYDDFSTPCFDSKHQMIIGGSFASTGDEASPWARFHFRPHFFQHAGFRLVHSSAGDGGAARLDAGSSLP